jgi:hypothetical protein
VYRSWVQVTPSANFVSWAVNLYVERIDNGCTAAGRHGSPGCAAADLLLTN